MAIAKSFARSWRCTARLLVTAWPIYSPSPCSLARPDSTQALPRQLPATNNGPSVAPTRRPAAIELQPADALLRAIARPICILIATSSHDPTRGGTEAAQDPNKCREPSARLSGSSRMTMVQEQGPARSTKTESRLILFKPNFPVFSHAYWDRHCQ